MCVYVQALYPELTYKYIYVYYIHTHTHSCHWGSPQYVTIKGAQCSVPFKYREAASNLI